MRNDRVFHFSHSIVDNDLIGIYSDYQCSVCKASEAALYEVCKGPYRKPRKVVYLIGSLRNQGIVEIGNKLRDAGFEAFDQWLSPGPEADDNLKLYAKARGQTMRDCLADYAAQHVFQFDKTHLDRADMAVMVMPAGKSACMELGYTIGRGKPAYIVYPDGEPEERWDVMFQFATDILYSVDELLNVLKAHK